MSAFDEFTKLRLRKADRIAHDPELFGGGMPSFVGLVTSTGSNIAVGSFLMVQAQYVLGAEVEGGAGSFSSVPGVPIPVYLAGPGLPATGDAVVCRFVDHRWVTERTGAGTGTTSFGTIPSCYCTPIPATLTMTSADPKCNYQMFQSCTIQYGPAPAWAAPLNLGANVFLSTASFPDPITGGASFHYYLTCRYNEFSLSRIYPTSPYGSPYRDGILYSWLIGSNGNTCSPFHLDNGTSFPGSDPSCSVKIDQ